MLPRLKLNRTRNSKGAAVSEYGALLAFVCVLIVIAFAFTPKSYGTAILNAYSTIESDLNAMAATANNGGVPPGNGSGNGNGNGNGNGP